MLNTMRHIRICLTLLMTFVLYACGGGISSGGGFFTCDDAGGTWEGNAVSESGNRGGVISISLNQTDCKFVGAVAFPPCVPVTPINGSASSLIGDLNTVETVDGSLLLEDTFLRDLALGNTRAAVPLGQQQEMSYVFTNTQNLANCPTSDTGIVVLTKIK